MMVISSHYDLDHLFHQVDLDDTIFESWARAKKSLFQNNFFMKPLWKEYETHYDQIYASKTIS